MRSSIRIFQRPEMPTLHVPHANILCIWDILPRILIKLPRLRGTIKTLHDHNGTFRFRKKFITSYEPFCPGSQSRHVPPHSCCCRPDGWEDDEPKNTLTECTRVEIPWNSTSDTGITELLNNARHNLIRDGQVGKPRVDEQDKPYQTTQY